MKAYSIDMGQWKMMRLCMMRGCFCITHRLPEMHIILWNGTSTEIICIWIFVANWVVQFLLSDFLSEKNNELGKKPSEIRYSPIYNDMACGLFHVPTFNHFDIQFREWKKNWLSCAQFDLIKFHFVFSSIHSFRSTESQLEKTLITLRTKLSTLNR